MAGSPNAFANMNGGQPRSSVLTEQDHNARSPKRVRLSEHAVASIHTQRAYEDTSLEVDYMILDYLAQHGIKACFASSGLDSSNTSGAPHVFASNLAMFNAFLSIFRARHPTYEPDAELRLRILLLKLATLSTQRLTSNPTTPSPSALLSLRAANKERARKWIASSGRLPSSHIDSTKLDTELPMTLPDLERNRAKVLHELGIPAEDEDYEDAFYGTSSCVSLMDILPLFIELSAARNAMNESNLTDRWMGLACEFMLQACLEQYLVFGASGSDALDEAFAWGYLDMKPDAMEVDGAIEKMSRDRHVEINAMFEDEEYAIEVDGWKDMKMSFIEALLPLAPINAMVVHGDAFQENVVSRLENLSAVHSSVAFESNLLTFLQAISKSLPEPVLIQLEKGKLAGMTEQETESFLRDNGIQLASLLTR